jgi:hypothetical protein
MLEKTVYLIIKAFVVGVLINIGLQHVSTTPLPASGDTILRENASDQNPLNTEFHVTNQMEK